MQNSENCVQIHRNVDVDKIQHLENTVEILTEQVETLKLELDYKNQELSEIKEELNYINQELCILNELYTDSLVLLAINEDRELENNLLASKKTAKSNRFSQTDFLKIGSIDKYAIHNYY